MARNLGTVGSPAFTCGTPPRPAARSHGRWTPSPGFELSKMKRTQTWAKRKELTRASRKAAKKKRPKGKASGRVFAMGRAAPSATDLSLTDCSTLPEAVHRVVKSRKCGAPFDDIKAVQKRAKKRELRKLHSLSDEIASAIVAQSEKRAIEAEGSQVFDFDLLMDAQSMAASASALSSSSLPSASISDPTVASASGKSLSASSSSRSLLSSLSDLSYMRSALLEAADYNFDLDAAATLMTQTLSDTLLCAMEGGDVIDSQKKEKEKQRRKITRLPRSHSVEGLCSAQMPPPLCSAAAADSESYSFEGMPSYASVVVESSPRKRRASFDTLTATASIHSVGESKEKQKHSPIGARRSKSHTQLLARERRQRDPIEFKVTPRLSDLKGRRIGERMGEGMAESCEAKAKAGEISQDESEDVMEMEAETMMGFCDAQKDEAQIRAERSADSSGSEWWNIETLRFPRDPRLKDKG